MKYTASIFFMKYHRMNIFHEALPHKYIPCDITTRIPLQPFLPVSYKIQHENWKTENSMADPVFCSDFNANSFSSENYFNL